MTSDRTSDEREAVSYMEAIANMDDLLPDLITLAASQPRQQALLQETRTEAH